MSDSVLTCRDEDGVSTLVMNRPGSANALSITLLDALLDQLYRLRWRTDVRVVVLTGAGDRAFCAGADLKERISMNDQEVRQTVAKIRAVVSGVAGLPMPVIAAVNGVAFGGGTELALAADLRVAANVAQFGLTETSLAIIPGAGGTQRLARLVGIAVAKELIYTARRISAQTALELGLVNRLVEPKQLQSEARGLAQEIAANGPLAVRQAKSAIDQGFDADLQTALAIEEKAYEVLIPTEDRLEGLRAFAEKRKPNYRGR